MLLSACSTGTTPNRPGLNANEIDLGRESSDASVEDDLDLGDNTDSVPDAAKEKRCVSLMGCLNYRGSSDRQYFLETHSQIMDNYGEFIRRGILGVTYQNVAHGWAEEAVECARNQAETEFFRYLAYLFENQEEWAHAVSPELFKEYAELLRLETEGFNRCADGRETYETVDRHIRECEDRGVFGTPTVFVNEREILGAQAYEVFAGAIGEELTECGLLEE